MNKVNKIFKHYSLRTFDALLEPEMPTKKKTKRATVPEIKHALQIVIARLMTSNQRFDEERIREELYVDLPQKIRRTIFDRGWYKEPVAQALKMQPFVTVIEQIYFPIFMS